MKGKQMIDGSRSNATSSLPPAVGLLTIRPRRRRHNPTTAQTSGAGCTARCRPRTEMPSRRRIITAHDQIAKGGSRRAR